MLQLFEPPQNWLHLEVACHKSDQIFLGKEITFHSASHYRRPLMIYNYIIKIKRLSNFYIFRFGRES